MMKLLFLREMLSIWHSALCLETSRVWEGLRSTTGTEAFLPPPSYKQET